MTWPLSRLTGMQDPLIRGAAAVPISTSLSPKDKLSHEAATAPLGNHRGSSVSALKFLGLTARRKRRWRRITPHAGFSRPNETDVNIWRSIPHPKRYCAHNRGKYNFPNNINELHQLLSLRMRDDSWGIISRRPRRIGFQVKSRPNQALRGAISTTVTPAARAFETMSAVPSPP